jgi:nitrile hydratase
MSEHDPRHDHDHPHGDAHDHDHGDHDHDHHHEHGHHHTADPSSPELRTEALESLLIEKGWVTREAIDRVVERFEHEIGPMRGAQVVARAWVDPAFKQRLLADGTSAIAEFGFEGVALERLEVKENAPGVHNVVVCTLCSCYPWAVLGLPPVWYKDFAYRSRVVREPRRVLREMGLTLEDEVEVRVWDSTSEVRFMVLPERPAGTEAMSEPELAALVTRDAMIGVAHLQGPQREPRA